MKTLFLIRHAKSSWEDSRLDDHERPLNHRGKDNAPRMAARLQELGIKPDALISSTARRAASTAQVFADHLDFPRDKILFDADLYLASVGILQKIIGKIEDSFQTVLIFGHNPGLTLLVSQVWGLPIGNLPTCGIVSLNFESFTWPEASSRLPKKAAFDFPKNSSPPISFSK